MTSLRRPPPKPRRQRRKAARPAEIIEAGLVEFAAQGYAGTRLEDVARRAGVAKGTIYLYFADKHALFQAVVRSQVVPVITEIDAFVEGYPGSSADLLRLLLQAVHDRLVKTDLKVLLRIIIAEGPKFPELTELYYQESVSRGRALISRIVRRGVERGELRSGPASDLPDVVIGPAVMAAIWSLTFQRYEPLDTERFAAAHIDLVLHGLLPRPA